MDRTKKVGCLIAGCLGTPLLFTVALLVVLDVTCGVSPADLAHAAAVGQGPFTPENRAESKRRGRAIVDALEVWHARHGAYPETLDALVPELLPELEPPLAGVRSWRYHRLEHGQSYRLSFAELFMAYPICVYSHEAWRCRETRAEAEAILAALAAWYAEHDVYPETLDELGLESPKADLGRWIYVPLPEGSEDGFRLTDDNDELCSVARGWYCDC